MNKWLIIGIVVVAIIVVVLVAKNAAKKQVAKSGPMVFNPYSSPEIVNSGWARVGSSSAEPVVTKFDDGKRTFVVRNV